MSLTYLCYSFLICYLEITSVGLLRRLNEKLILRILPDKYKKKKFLKGARGRDDDNDSDEK